MHNRTVKMSCFITFVAMVLSCDNQLAAAPVSEPPGIGTTLPTDSMFVTAKDINFPGWPASSIVPYLQTHSVVISSTVPVVAIVIRWTLIDNSRQVFSVVVADGRGPYGSVPIADGTRSVLVAPGGFVFSVPHNATQFSLSDARIVALLNATRAVAEAAPVQRYDIDSVIYEDNTYWGPDTAAFIPRFACERNGAVIEARSIAKDFSGADVSVTLRSDLLRGVHSSSSDKSFGPCAAGRGHQAARLLVQKLELTDAAFAKLIAAQAQMKFVRLYPITQIIDANP